jgi:hypothetical protein
MNTIINIRLAEDPAALMLALLDALNFGETVSILFDSRRAECVIPDHLRKPGGATFNYSHQFSPGLVPDPRIKVDTNGISATLAFGGVPFDTFVPWVAVGIAIVPNGVTDRVLAKMAKAAKRSRLRVVGDDEAPPMDTAPIERKRRRFRLVKGGAA